VSRHVALFVGLFLLQAVWAATAVAQGHTLRIESPNSSKAPKVIVGDKASVPTLDPVTGKWTVPIDPNPPNFVTSYLISSTDGSVVAIHLSIPGRILSSNQLVYLVPPSIKVVDEVTVRSLWNSNEIVSSPRDPRVQFRYLQDLVHINGVFRERYQDHPRLDATTLRSAFLLFQVVANLAQGTWYVIDPETQAIIDYARDTLVRGQQQGKTCAWLGPKACPGVGKLIANVKQLNSVRFTRMYNQLVPSLSALTLEACGGSLSQDLRTFLKFLHDANETDADNEAITERRVLGDIATCETRVALCTEQPADAAIAQLDATIALLEPYQALMRQRLGEVKRARQDLASGKPAMCPR